MKRTVAQQQSMMIQHAGYKQYEYLVILNPHEDLRKKISGIKQEFAVQFDAPTARWGKPYLALARFKQFAMMEERILAHLKVVAMGHYPFKVELSNFGSYPSHTIFINVTTKEPIKNLVRKIKPWQRLLKLDDDNKPHFLDDPVFTIARQLKPWQYEKAWPEYQQKHFTARFIADSMLLLKRSPGEKGYQIAARFEFQNLPVTTVQGELFG
jgi:2'-5' RNA ligase